jgi:hypothetical protein
MTPKHDDSQLREIFNTMRKQDEGASPAFEDLWDRARLPPNRRSRSIPTSRLLMTSGLVAATLLLVWVLRPGSPDFTEQPQLSEWKAPTDFLLKTPNQDLLERLPEIPSQGANRILQSLPPGNVGNKP